MKSKLVRRGIVPRGSRRVFEAPRTAFARPDFAATTIGRINGQWPTVILGPVAHGKMWALTQASPMEVGWLSSCTQLPDGNFVIDDVFVPKQVCTIATTNITPDGEAELLGELLQNGRMDVIKSLSCWGHSHANFGVSPSNQDDLQTQSFLRRNMKRGSQFFIRVIVNKRGDLYSTVYLLPSDLAVNNPLIVAEQPDASSWAPWAAEQLHAKVEFEEISAATYEGMEELEFEELPPSVLQRWQDAGYINPIVLRQIEERRTEKRKANA